jgi:hypothetical protein
MRKTALAWNAFIVVAIAAFLLFSGASLYPILWPIDHWDVACPTPTGISFLSTQSLKIEENYLELLKARNCTIMPVRQFLWAGRMVP